MRTIIDMIDQEEMTTGALGLFARMVKNSARDYKTFEEICEFDKVSTSEEIAKTLSELVAHEFLIHPDDEQKIYAVNKYKIFETQAFWERKTLCQNSEKR